VAPFGRSTIVARAAGAPAAATEVGGPPEILDESDCGVLLQPRAPERWAAELSRLLADRSALAAMGERGEAAARERFGMERHVARVREAYEEALPTAVLA
jgi:glycosyltransferase involved in cell wall biosynthesis